MGDLVYAEAQYNHDMKRLYDVFKYTEGDEWKKMAGLPPFVPISYLIDSTAYAPMG